MRKLTTWRGGVPAGGSLAGGDIPMSKIMGFFHTDSGGRVTEAFRARVDGRYVIVDGTTSSDVSSS